MDFTGVRLGGRSNFCTRDFTGDQLWGRSNCALELFTGDRFCRCSNFCTQNFTGARFFRRRTLRAIDSAINSTWGNTTTDGKTVGSNSRDTYSEANSNYHSSYDDGQSKNTSNQSTYTVNQSQETNSSNGPSYWQNNRDNNYSVTQTNDTQNYKDGPSTSSHSRDTYSLSKSNSSSSNSEGQVSSNSELENYSENNAQWESEYKADTYTTQSNSDESTITASKSNSSTEGNNSTSSNSSDTSRTWNSQTVTTYKDGQRTENGSSTYEKWSSESTYDSNGVASSVSKYSSWSSSYSKYYFKEGYSWTETVSGYDSESVTKGGVYTSNGSSWSWTRSGTEYDDGRNSWSESWSKSSWEDGEYLPGEYEVTGGSFHPEGTGTQMNNLPEFGEAPRLNKAPKQDVPPDLVKPPKPSDDIWQLPTVIFKEPQFKEVFGSSGSDSASGGTGNDDLADNLFGGIANNLPPDEVNGWSFEKKLIEAARRGLAKLPGDALSTIMRWEFWAQLLATLAVFATLSLTGLGEIAAIIYALSRVGIAVEAVKELFSYVFSAFYAKNHADLNKAAEHFKHFASLAGQELVGVAFRRIRLELAKQGHWTTRFDAAIQNNLASTNAGTKLEARTANLLKHDLISYGRIEKGANKLPVGDVDVETSNAIIEVTMQTGQKAGQIAKLQTDRLLNPSNKPVILFAPNYTELAQAELPPGVRVFRTEQGLLDYVTNLR